MASPYVKSAAWLLACSGLGYVLFLACTPGDTEIEKIKKSNINKTENLKHREQLVEALQAALVETPVYLRSKKE